MERRERIKLAGRVREIRNHHGHGNVRLLRRLDLRDGKVESRRLHLEESIQRLDEGRLLMFNDAAGSTRAEEI